MKKTESVLKDIIDNLQDQTVTPTKEQKKLVHDYNEDKIVEAKITTSKKIITIWKFVVVFNTIAAAFVILLSGFKFYGFELSDPNFITTMIAFVISSFLLGSATKLLKIER